MLQVERENGVQKLQNVLFELGVNSTIYLFVTTTVTVLVSGDRE